MAAATKDLSHTEPYALRSFTFDSENSFYKDHNEKDEYCISIQMCLSLGYLPEEKSWQSVKPAWIFDMACEPLDHV